MRASALRRLTLLALGLLLPVLFACGDGADDDGGASPGVTQSPEAAEQAVGALADRYYEAWIRHFPEVTYFIGVELERHDGLSDNSPAGLSAWHRVEDTLLAELESIETGLLEGRQAWVTAGVLREVLEAGIGRRICRRELWSPSQMQGWQIELPQLAELQPVGTPELRRQALERWRKVPGFVRQDLANLRRGLDEGYSAPKSVVRRVIDQLDRLLALDRETSPFLSPARRDDDPDFAAALSELVEGELLPALREHRDFLHDEYLDRAREALGVASLPDGEACYRAMLRSYTTLDRGPRQVHDLGRATVEANKAEVEALGRELYGLSDFADILARVEDDPENRFASKDEVLELSRSLVREAEGRMPDWFGRLPSRPVVVEPYPDYQDGTGVSSRYEPARGDSPGVYRIALARPEEQKKSGAEIVAVHEAYPGHHLQIAIAQDLEGVHKLAELVYNAAYAEGWARYSEALAEEIGLFRQRATPIDRRAWPARGMVVDPGIHVLGWSRRQARDFLLESGRMSEQRAEEMIDRIADLPGQLTAYDSGGLEIFALRAEAERALGERFDIRQFHDRVLANGAIPLPMLRQVVEAWIADADG